MTYNLPAHGEPNWDAKLDPSMQYLKDTAEAAETPAGAQAKATAAQNAAVATAATDAQTKADAARDAAIGAAANDATTKANSVQSALNTHTGNLANPHSVTKAQVGLGNVPNVDATARANHTGTQAASTISDLEPSLRGSYGRAVNLESYSGVDPNGVVECSAAIQAAINAAESAGTPLIAASGSYFKIGAGITITKDCDLSRATFEFTGTTGTAITVGPDITRKTIKLPYITASAKTAVGWAQVAGTVGVKLVNCSVCDITLRDVTKFETGVLLYGQTSAGTVWNSIRLGNVVNNKVNLKFDATGNGYTNQNVFIGGRFNHDGSEGTLVAGTRHILMANSSPFIADGNNFYGTSLESVGVVEEIIESYGWYNEWHGCRWENTGAAGTKKIHWKGTAKGNRIHSGYEAELLTVVADAGTANNFLDSPFVDQSIWIPASALVLASGAPALARVGGVPYWTLRDGTADEVSAEALIPSGWSQVDVSFVWFSENGAAGNVSLYGKTQSHVAGASVGFGSFAGAGATVAAGAASVVAITKTGAGVAVTPGPTHFSAARDGAAAGDTSAGNIGLLGIRLDRVA